MERHGPRWIDRRTPEVSGASFSVSVLLTLALFASSFLAMRTVTGGASATDDDRSPPVVIRLAPPASQPLRREAASRPAAVVSPDIAVNTPSVSPLPAMPSNAAPAAPETSTPRDTSARRGAQAPSTVPLGIAPPPSGLADTAMGVRGGAPMAPSGVTIGGRNANTARFRDSVVNLRIKTGVSTWMDHLPTGRELRELESSRSAARALATRTTTSGNGRGVNVMQGEGMNGEGAVGGAAGGLGSVSAPLFSPGRSAAQRKRDEKLDADYQLRLRRLQDRLIARRDSLRADSLRRDSLARTRKP